MVMLPSFKNRRAKAREIKFVKASEAFEPQIKVQVKNDISGWANRENRVKWSIPAGAIVYVDEKTAREFSVKGYAEIIDGKVKPVSPDEAAEMLSTVTTINMGVPRG